MEASVLTAAIEMAERDHDTLMKERIQWLDEFPARITAWSASTQRASWTEETFDANGQRIVKPDGRTGSATYSPAFPVGNGLMPPDQFPVSVWLRRRVDAVDSSNDEIGPVYEFDWLCACGVGSGSGTTGVLLPCCPGPIPSTLTATATQTVGTPCAIDGAEWTLTYDGVDTWEGVTDVGGVAFTVALTCSDGTWTATITTDNVDCEIGGNAAIIQSCAPFMLGIGISSVQDECPVCNDAEFLITVTE